jgi:hypothetical protein
MMVTSAGHEIVIVEGMEWPCIIVFYGSFCSGRFKGNNPIV